MCKKCTSIKKQLECTKKKSKFMKKKNASIFWNNLYPENLLPTKRLVKREKQIVNDKKNLIRKLKKRVENREKLLLQSTQKTDLNSKKIRFLFSSYQLNNSILKRQTLHKGFSEFLMKLKEKKKISILYGNVSKKFFEKAFNKAVRYKGRIDENLLLQYEMRLDVILYRISFCKTIYTAKQYIAHNLVLVNGKILNIPTYQVKAGDIISINHPKKEKIVKGFVNDLKKKLSKRGYRYLFSYKTLKRSLKKGDDFSKIINRIKKKLKFIITKNILSKSKIFKNKRSTFFSKSKRLALLEGLSKINKMLLKKTIYSTSHKVNLKLLKKWMQRKRSYQNRTIALGISILKPLHLEVSYKLLTAIVLFSPQKIGLPTIINTEFLTRNK